MDIQRRISRYKVSSPLIQMPVMLAVVTDLHNGVYADVLPVLRNCDAILTVGDLVNRHKDGYDRVLSFLADAPKCAPTFFSIGNHERKDHQMVEIWPYLRGSSVTLLDNQYTVFRGLVLGGFSSAAGRKPEGAFLAEMARHPGFHLLMCHHPEYYYPYVKAHGLELTLSGHAHGGQIQFRNRGLYAPGQGLLPRLTHGFYDDGHLLVSRGMTNSSGLPRWNNPCELVLLQLCPGAHYHAEVLY